MTGSGRENRAKMGIQLCSIPQIMTNVAIVAEESGGASPPLREESATATNDKETKAASETRESRVLAGRKLAEAAQFGHLEQIRDLLPQADLSVTNRLGRNALAAAVRAMRSLCVKEMLPWFDVKAPDKKRGGQTLLMDAVASGWPAGVELLLPHSDAKAKNDKGWTALMRAASKNVGGEEMLSLLIPRSDVEASDSNGWTALMIAATVGAQNVATLLPASNPNATNAAGETALMAAIDAIRVDCAETLIPVSDLRVRDKTGKTALDHAIARPNLVGAPLHERIRRQMALNEQSEIIAEIQKHGVKTNSESHKKAPSRVRKAPRAL